MIDAIKYEVKNFNPVAIVIGFAEIRFEFPEGTLHSCLCVKDARYGLVSPLKGRTIATIAELNLARRQGAVIDYIEAFVIKSLDGFIFKGALKHLIDKRAEAQKNNDTLLDQSNKLIINSMYGKLGQGVSPKSSSNNWDKGYGALGTSAITQAYYAAMITGTLRACLSSILVAVDELNEEGHDYKIISATTDGVLYKLTSKSDIKFNDALKDEHHNDVRGALQSGGKIFNIFEDVDPILYNKLLEFPAIRLLHHARKEWGHNEFLEIKHAVNSILNIKTRGQIGAYNATR